MHSAKLVPKKKSGRQKKKKSEKYRKGSTDAKKALCNFIYKKFNI